MVQQDELRLFVAVDLPERVRRALGRLQDDLRGRVMPRLRWVRPEGIHLTLKFLGETPAAEVPAIEGALAAAVAGTAPFRLALGSLGTFGGRRRLRVVWLDIGGEVRRLRELQSSVAEGLREAGYPAEEREFTPHLTLARVQQPAPAGAAEFVSAALAAVSPPPVEFAVEEIALMRSRLGPGGAVYERLATFPLS